MKEMRLFMSVVVTKIIAPIRGPKRRALDNGWCLFFLFAFFLLVLAFFFCTLTSRQIEQIRRGQTVVIESTEAFTRLHGPLKGGHFARA